MRREIPAHVHVRAAVRDFLAARVTPGDRILVGVSGGTDSMALARVLLDVAAELTVTPIALVVDHALQPGSAELAEAVRQRLVSMGFAHALVRKVHVDVRLGGGLEAAARNARHAAFTQVLAEENAIAVLLAHTLDDQAETVLLRLARGSGTRSLSAMAAERGAIWRPLLEIRREELESVIAHYGIDIWQDPHNQDPRFLRVRVRHELMPVFQEILGESVVEALARTASMARDDNEALDEWAATVAADCDGGELCIELISGVPKAVGTRVVRRWLLSHGCDGGGLTALHVEQTWRLATHPRVRGPVKVVGGFSIEKSSGRLRALN